MQFHQYTIILFLFPLGSTCLLILQLLIDRLHKNKNDSLDRYTKMLLYSIYLSAMCCGFIGWSLHISNNRIWCENIGFPPCFAMYGLSKAFVVGFFLRRAKLAQGMINNQYIYYFFNYIGPLYLIIYFIVYCVLSTIVFEGAYHQVGLSHCQFGRWEIWFPFLAGFVDIFNSIGSLLLFVYPLLRAMKQYKKMNSKNNSVGVEKLGFISTMKWNVFLTTIATVSSFTALFMVMPAEKYVWLFCLGDPLLNAVCVFNMISPNRMFIKRLCKSVHVTCSNKSETELAEKMPKTRLEMVTTRSEITVTRTKIAQPKTITDEKKVDDTDIEIVYDEKKGKPSTPKLSKLEAKKNPESLKPSKLKAKKNPESPASPLMLTYDMSYNNIKVDNKQ
eukprot:515874_1